MNLSRLKLRLLFATALSVLLPAGAQNTTGVSSNSTAPVVAVQQTTNAPAGGTVVAPTALVPATPTVPAVPASTLSSSISTEDPKERAALRRESETDDATVSAQPVELPQDLASAISLLSFDRTPKSLYEVVRVQQSGGKLSETDRFRLAVLLGDWAAVGKALQGLPATDAQQAYTRLLQTLASNSQSAAQFYQPTIASRNPQPGMEPEEVSPPQPAKGAREKRGLLLSDDFYAVLDAAPADLTATHLPSLSALIKVAIGPGDKPTFLTRLQKGLKGYGGSTPSGCKLAAQLLSSVGWMSDSAPYLPLKREEWDNADTITLVLAMEYFTQTGIEQRDERQLKRAAELCAFMMQTSRFAANDSGLFRQATDRFVKLLPALEAGEAEQLIRENFLTQPAILVDLMLALGESGQQAQRGSDPNLRGQSLAMQNIVLRVLASRKSALPEAVNVLVMNWLTEAETTYRSGLPATPNPDEFNNPFVYLPPSYYQKRRETKGVLTADVILAQAPPPALVRRLNQGLAQRVSLTLLKVNLLNPKEPVTLDTLAAYLKEHPSQEKELCQDYLAAWVKKRSVPPEDPNIVRMRNMGYMISRPQQSAGGIPLTRLRQNLNITEFKNLLTSLRALSPEPIDASAVVQGFMAIHSGAEVYRPEDIETIFGPADKMDRSELMLLVTGMRTKLREQWQDSKTQQAAGTNRSEQETKDEVSRGYRTALDLVRRGLRPEDADWKQFIVRGQLFFDAAEYEFARQIKLTEYVSLRDEAFSSYRKAAEIYAAKVPEMARGQWTLEPYQMWFFVMLGASDLSQLTRTAARSDPGLKQIGDAMRALPGEAAEGHLQKFGLMLGELLPQVPANMRQKFLHSGKEVVGESHPSAKAALEALGNYQELLDEAQLHVTLDGSSRVGHAEPFGLFLGLQHTRQLARESGGFSKYLQNATQQKNPYMMGMPANQKANYRDDLTKNIHAALDETFEIASITFQDAEARSVDLPREGWQETPLAYVLLRAKEAAVDRIPSIQLDMDFSDTSGQVILPVLSQVESINATDSEAPLRPCDDLGLTFTMDEREWNQGRVVVEVTAKGKGVIPSHTRLFDYVQKGFDAQVADNGLSITELVNDGKTQQAQADRNWQFAFQRNKDLRGDATLHFPALKPGIKAACAEYKHYQDADLVTVEPRQALAGVRLSGRVSSLLRNLLIVLVLAALGIAAWWFLRARNRQSHLAETALQLPAQVTPFTVAAFLRRLQRESGSQLGDGDRQALTLQIREIESAFFSGTTPAGSTPDLLAIARKWLQALS
jgi:hypothetical protein